MLKPTLFVSVTATVATALATLGAPATATPAPATGAPVAGRQATSAPAVTAATAATASTASTAARRAARAGGRRHIVYREWSGRRALRRGSGQGVRVTRRGVQIADPVAVVRYRDAETGRSRRYAVGRWRSPWVRPGFGLTEAVASWDAHTPRGTFVSIDMRVRSASGRRSSWDSLGNWASHERRFHRMTLGTQTDDLTSVAADTLRANGAARLTRWQVRVVLYRAASSSATPRLRRVGAMVSRLPDGDAPTTRTRMRRTRVLDVPRRSQMIHRGHYPRWGGGGQAWCSPTSTTMLLRFWNRGPGPRAYRWVPDGHRDPDVDHAARSVYDYGYEGAGNWAFNTAHTARYGLDSFVTRLRSLREAERFIRAGIPLVASIRFGSGELDGAPIGSTDGHLVVVRGFTGTGRVVVNDPAASSKRGVRRVYRRGQFADAWVGGSGGLVYVMRPRGEQLPRPGAEANW